MWVIKDRSKAYCDLLLISLMLMSCVISGLQWLGCQDADMVSGCTNEVVSNTDPLDMNDTQNIISHSLAAEYLGKKLLFLECGSNSNSPININLLKKISQFINIPIMVGGGIKDKKTAIKLANNGASYLVIGSLLEDTLDHSFLLDMNESIRRSNGNN